MEEKGITKRTDKRRRYPVRHLFLLIATALALTLPAHSAEKYPAKAVRLVITHAAGTSNDIEARTVQPFLQKYLGVPLVIEDMPGTAGRKSREFVFKQKPDGYTLLSTGFPATQIGEILFNGQYHTPSFTYISSLFSDSIVLQVRSDSPYKNMTEFAAKHKGKILSCAVPGVGSGSHLNAMSLIHYLGLTASWVPFDGGTQALTALMGGHVDYVVGNIGGSEALTSAGSIRNLMVFDEARDPRAPDVPTYKDLGYKLNPISNIRVVVGPPGLSGDKVKILETAYLKASQDKEFLALAKRASVVVSHKGSKESAAIAQNVWKEVKGQEANLKAMIKSTK